MGSGAHLVCVWAWVMLMYSKDGCVGGLVCGIIVCLVLLLVLAADCFFTPPLSAPLNSPGLHCAAV